MKILIFTTEFIVNRMKNKSWTLIYISFFVGSSFLFSQKNSIQGCWEERLEFGSVSQLYFEKDSFINIEVTYDSARQTSPRLEVMMGKWHIKNDTLILLFSPNYDEASSLRIHIIKQRKKKLKIGNDYLTSNLKRTKNRLKCRRIDTGKGEYSWELVEL